MSNSRFLSISNVLIDSQIQSDSTHKKRRAWPDWPIKAFPKITAQSPTTEGPVEGRGETPFGFDVIF